jgi:hypothetical protein
MVYVSSPSGSLSDELFFLFFGGLTKRAVNLSAILIKNRWHFLVQVYLHRTIQSLRNQPCGIKVLVA